jgi:hypothetical protein
MMAARISAYFMGASFSVGGVNEPIDQNERKGRHRMADRAAGAGLRTSVLGGRIIDVEGLVLVDRPGVTDRLAEPSGKASSVNDPRGPLRGSNPRYQITEAPGLGPASRSVIEFRGRTSRAKIGKRSIH